MVKAHEVKCLALRSHGRDC